MNTTQSKTSGFVKLSHDQLEELKSLQAKEDEFYIWLSYQTKLSKDFLVGRFIPAVLQNREGVLEFVKQTERAAAKKKLEDEVRSELGLVLPGESTPSRS